MDEHSDFYVCEEALNVLYDVFGDVDLTLVENTNTSINLIATTLNNEDNINALTNMVKYYLLRDGGRLAETVQIKARPDVYETKFYSLNTGDFQTYLIIDTYDANYSIDREALKDIFDVLSLLVKVNILEKDKTSAYKVDSLTRVYTRDSLLKDLKTLIESDIVEKNAIDVSLFVLYITNGTDINKTKGYEHMDSVLLKIARTLLKNEKKSYVYRIGGMKFAILAKQPLQELFRDMQKMLDRVSNIDQDLLCSAMVVPLLDDPYKTVYCAERYIKDIDCNMVALYRDDPSMYVMDEKADIEYVVQVGVEDITYVEDIIERKIFSDSDIIVENKEDLEAEEAELEEDDEEVVLDFGDEEDSSDDDEDGEALSFEYTKPKKGKNRRKNGQMSLFDL